MAPLTLRLLLHCGVVVIPIVAAALRGIILIIAIALHHDDVIGSHATG